MLNQEASRKTIYTQYSRAALNSVLATGTFFFFNTTGFSWFLGAVGAEVAEAYEPNTDTTPPFSIREETALQNYLSHHFQHRSLEQTIPQSDTIIEGGIIGQLSLNDKITDYTVRDNYAYVTAGESGFHIIDVTNASNPITIGQYNTTGFAHQLQLIGNYTYIAYDLAGLRIVDVSDVYNPFLAGVYMMGDNPEKEAVTHVAVAGDVAVLARPDSTELKAIDVSAPTQVFRVWIDTPGEAHRVAIAGNFAYVVNTYWGIVLQIIDVSNPADPKLACNYEMSDSANDAAIVGNLAYVVGGSLDLKIIDVSNPVVPQLRGTYKISGVVRGVTVVGNYAYMAFAYGLQIIDISNSTEPQLVGSCNTLNNAHDVTVVGNLAYVADRSSGLQIIDISNPANPQVVGSYNTLSSARYVTVVGNLAYVADGHSGLKIINISYPSNPQLTGIYNTPGSVEAVVIIGNHAYIADEDNGLQIINITNSTNPQLVGSYDTIDQAYGVSVVGNLAYVADYTAGLQIINTDVSQLLVFSFKNQALGEQEFFSYNSYLFLTLQDRGLVCISKDALAYKGYDTSGSARDIVIVGNLAYVADKSSGLQIIDVSNPADPQLVGSYDTPGTANAIAVVGNLVYVADDDAGLQLIDISNLADPQLVGSYDTIDQAYGVIVVGNLAYVADDDAGLLLIDISNPVNPQLVGSYDTPGRAKAITVVANLAYVACRSSGLQIIDINIPPPYIGYYNTPTSRAYGVIVVDSFAYVADVSIC